MRRSWCLALALPLAAACVPEGVDRTAGDETPMPGTMNPDTTPLPEPDPQVILTGMTVTPAKSRIEVMERLELAVTGYGEDGAEYDLTARAAWQSSDPTVLVVEGAGRVRGLALGSATIRIVHEELEAEATVDVVDGSTPEPEPEPVAVSLALTPATFDAEVGAEVALGAVATYDDGSTVDVGAEVTWTSDDDAVASVSGLTLTANAAGSTQVRASWSGLTAALPVTVTAPNCTYPGSPSSPIQVGSTMPPLAWNTAVAPDGSVQPLVLEDVHCGQAGPTPSVIIFVVGAGWCSACPSYIRNMDSQAAAIEAAGGQIVYVEAQDSRYNLASSSYADSYITNLVGRNHGTRIGDADTQPNSGALYGAPLLRVFPSAFVVRTSDMKIIVDQASSNGMLPYVRIAQNPNGDWSNPNAPPFSNNCGPTDEETYEPNDTASQASTLPAGSSFQGGICTAAGDFYRIDIPGNWRLDLVFTHSVGDIDVYVWDEARDRAVESGGQKVGSDSATDNESFTHTGPALVKVLGYNGASAPYQLSLTAN